MKMMPFDINDIQPHKNRSEIVSILEKFLSLNCDAVWLDWKNEGFKTARSLVTSLLLSIKKEGLDVSVIQRGENVYLVRKEKMGNVQ